MTRFFAIAALLVASYAQAGPLEGGAVLVESGVATVLTAPFGAPGPEIDVYHVVVNNPNVNPATSIELNLSGPFLNNFTFSTLDFQDNTSLPAPAGTPVADSFFVTPPGTVGIGRDDIDDANGILSAAYTIQGGATFIEAGGSSVLAVLSVPTGTPVEQNAWTGFAAVDGVLETIEFIPEPSTAILAGLALVGFAARRNG